MLCYTYSMKFKLNETLLELNNIFKNSNTPLYIVGGFVRDCLLQYAPADIDLASALTNEKLFELLKNTNFKVVESSNKLGTCIITKNNIQFEHTTFRKDFYLKGGFHTPEKVEFIQEVKEDAYRRDFTINSFYYDIENDTILDYFDGIKDLKNKIIKTIIAPEKVFESDGLRILRMIRFALELGFNIENNTYLVAKEMVFQLNDITKDRLYKEFNLILNAQEKYGCWSDKAFNQFLNLGALTYIFKSLKNYESAKSLKHLYEELFYFFLPNNPYKLQTFLLDFSLYFEKLENIKASVLLSKILQLDTCGISKREKKDAIDLVKAYEQFKKCSKDETVRKFIQDHKNKISQLLFLFNNEKDKNEYEKLKHNYDIMLKYNIPFTRSELKIDGKMVEKELNLKNKKEIGVYLEKALKFCALEPKNNTKRKLFSYLKNIQQKEKK